MGCPVNFNLNNCSSKEYYNTCHSCIHYIELVERYKNEPWNYVKEVLGISLYDWQIETWEHMLSERTLKGDTYEK